MSKRPEGFLDLDKILLTLSVDKSGEVLHHMCDLGESPDVSVYCTISIMTSPSVRQLHDSSVC